MTACPECTRRRRYMAADPELYRGDDARRDAKRTAAECDAAVADARRERDAARTRAVVAEAERDALQRRLAEMATREPSEYEITQVACIGDAHELWRYVRDALMTAQECEHCGAENGAPMHKAWCRAPMAQEPQA